VDAGGKEVVGTFANGESFMVEPGDQVMLLDRGGAVVDSVSIRASCKTSSLDGMLGPSAWAKNW
jgi:hypothetical protein